MKLPKNMKNFLKHWSKKINLIVVAVFILAAVLRFYNFPSRVTFWSEQARSLIVSAEYLKKPSLLGQEYFRQASSGHTVFSGALFNYSLVPLLFIGNWNPVPITAYFALLNLLTGLIIYFAVKKLFGENLALFSTILFLFNDLMVYHSLFIWNYNYLPLIGILIFYFSLLNIKKSSSKYIFVLGLLSGIGISLQVLFLLPALLILIINLRKDKTKAKNFVVFILGALLGNLPMILFDLRHGFYQTKTLWQYFLDTLAGKSDAGFAYYYLLPFWPVFAVVAGFIFLKIYKFNKFIGIAILTIYLFLNITSGKIDWHKPTGMPDGLRVSDVDYASKRISEDAKGDFNVSEVLDFDKRAYVFRYFVQYKYGKVPQGVADYPNSKLLYVLSGKDYNFPKSNIWEVSIGGPFKVTLLTDVGTGYAIYKLTK